MKNIFAFTALLAVSVATTVSAASLSVTTTGTGVNTAYSVYLNGGADNDNFDTINMIATPTSGNTFLNPNTGLASSFPRSPGEPSTFRNRFLDRDPGEGDGGRGYSQFGAVQTTAGLEFTVAALGGTISTAGEPGGNLFLANFNINTPIGNPSALGQATVTIFSAGNVVGTPLTVTFPDAIPEPATLAMAGMGLVGIIAASRRRKA